MFGSHKAMGSKATHNQRRIELIFKRKRDDNDMDEVEEDHVLPLLELEQQHNQNQDEGVRTNEAVTFQGVPRNWLQALTNLSDLTVLTLCSCALRRVSAKARDRSLTKSGAASCKLRNLRALQLLMFAMYNGSLDDIYVFIVACCPPLLERLFVQLPTNSHYYRPGSEPSESEEELLEENGPVEELRGEEPPEENGPEEELAEEEDELQEELPDGELSEEEDELQDELPEGEASEEKQTEEDWSDEELSDGGQLEEEPVEDCLENLKLLKMTNFKGATMR